MDLIFDVARWRHGTLMIERMPEKNLTIRIHDKLFICGCPVTI
jgi:hypothetical protein